MLTDAILIAILVVLFGWLSIPLGLLTAWLVTGLVTAWLGRKS